MSASKAVSDEVATTPDQWSKMTPMMQQYMQTKAEYPDALLFYRMGDFYELFFDDAITAASVLDIALTKRGKQDDQAIPMCGVPHHSYEPYLQKLIRSGHNVAICEQMESPEEAKKRGYKAVVKREVVRVVTPGTVVEDGLLDAKQANYLACFYHKGDEGALAWVDISTGEFHVSNSSLAALPSDIERLGFKELLLSDRLVHDESMREMLDEHRHILVPRVASMFHEGRSLEHLQRYYQVMSLDAYGDFSSLQLIACGALLEYIELTQCGSMPRLEAPSVMLNSNYMMIDPATRKNLEIHHTLSGQKQGSLLSVIDRTLSAVGARMFARRIAAPLVDAGAVTDRLDAVDYGIQQLEQCDAIRDILQRLPDMERALSRICIGKGGPRDLWAIREGLRVVVDIRGVVDVGSLPKELLDALQGCIQEDTFLQELEAALCDEVGVLARDGGYIRDGFDNNLDGYRQLRDNGKEELSLLKQKYRDDTGVSTLKVTHNNVLGYFVEVTPTNASRIDESVFVHRQTLASAVRYTTQELRDLEQRLLSAKDEALALELSIFQRLVDLVISHADAIVATAQSLAVFDVSMALAVLARECNYVRPNVDMSRSFALEGARHPVVEVFLQQSQGESFIANDCTLEGEATLWLLTGPNMAGKSTFLRQNALIAIMAQMGGYVPATSAHIGVVDKVFSRVGASDDLARGRSTFMVEMVETAAILNQASDRSLVILDEIGRGTATYDGLSIAWAVVEHLHNRIKCRGLFATHYHELTALASTMDELSCYTMNVKEWNKQVVFLHEVVKGAADRSYGIHVASLAGLPRDVIDRANVILEQLQDPKSNGKSALVVDDLPLFTQAQSTPAQPSQVEETLRDMDVDAMTPKQALDMLYSLKEEVV